MKTEEMFMLKWEYDLALLDYGEALSFDLNDPFRGKAKYILKGPHFF